MCVCVCVRACVRACVCVILEHEDKNVREGRADMESSDSNNKDSHSYFSESVFFSKLETQHNIHMWSII